MGMTITPLKKYNTDTGRDCVLCSEDLLIHNINIDTIYRPTLICYYELENII